MKSPSFSSGSNASRRFRIVAVAALLSMTNLPVAAQSLPTSTLLRRLAEAIDGVRGGPPLFVVVHNRFPNEVVGVFAKRDSAESAASRAGPEVEVFGPYAPPTLDGPPYGQVPPRIDPSLEPPRFFGCWHTFSSAMAPHYCPDWHIPWDAVEEVGLTLTLRGGRTVTVAAPHGVDAVFLSIQAIDKFVIPYYSRIVGPAEALRMRAEFDQLSRRR